MTELGADEPVKNDDKVEVKVHTVTSGVFDEELEFEWHIPQYLVVKSSNQINALNFRFSVGDLGPQGVPVTRWSCHLKELTSKSKKVGIFLQLEPGSPPFVGRVSATFQALKRNNEYTDEKIVRSSNFIEGKSKGLKKFLPGKLEDLEQLILEDESIHLRINLKFVIFQAADEIDKPEEVVVDLEEEELRSLEKNEWLKITKIRMEGIGGVVRLDKENFIQVVCKDMKRFWGSTLMLSGRSPEMEKIFNFDPVRSQLDKGQKLTAVFREVGGRTMEVLLQFIHGGILVREEWREEEVILELTWVAVKWGLEGLVGFLDKVIPEIEVEEETMIKLAWLTKEVELKNAEKGLREKLRGRVGAEEEVDQLIEERVKEPLFKMDPAVVFM